MSLNREVFPSSRSKKDHHNIVRVSVTALILITIITGVYFINLYFSTQNKPSIIEEHNFRTDIMSKFNGPPQTQASSEEIDRSINGQKSLKK